MSPEASARARNLAAAMRGAACGIALFFGLFSLANALVAFRTGTTEDLWWIDLHGLPAWVSGIVWLLAAALVAYAVAPVLSKPRRILTASVSAILACAAIWNVAGFYSAWREGLITPGLPVPFSAVVAVSFAFVGLVAGLQRQSSRPSGTERLVAVLVAAIMMVAFPLAQVAFFGTTDYRREADTAVVLGAKVHSDGRLSVSLEDRVRTAAELYSQGLVQTLIMSGGVGESGYDETVAMRDRAIELGVPASAIVLDNLGVDTDHTVANTANLLDADGADRVLVVSQFYHLPRVKMAYRAAGWQVFTVPAEKSVPISKTPCWCCAKSPRSGCTGRARGHGLSSAGSPRNGNDVDVLGRLLA